MNTETERNTNWAWQKPELTRAGQIAFWNGQSTTYARADMTTDNQPEIQHVIEHVRQHDFGEIITLGGAVGCRDPKMILSDAYCSTNGHACVPLSDLPSIFFNDLAPEQVEWAKTQILNRCQQECGVSIAFRPGSIHEVCLKIKPAHRVLLLGVYRAESFFKDKREAGTPLTGFDGYLANSETLGDHFWFDWLVWERDELKTESSGFEFTVKDSGQKRFKQALLGQYKAVSASQKVLALQIVSEKKAKKGYFLSHWYSPSAMTDFLKTIFPPTQFTMKMIELPKGALFFIKKKQVITSGVITMLNNVQGNIIPSEQVVTLENIRAIL